MTESKNTDNVSCFPAQNSENGAGDHISGEDAPENRQDPVAVTLPRAAAAVLRAFAFTHLLVREKHGWGDSELLRCAIAALDNAQPLPDQGEHVAQRQVSRCGEACLLYAHDGSYGFCHHPDSPEEMQVTGVNLDGSIQEVNIAGDWQDYAPSDGRLESCPAPPQCPLRRSSVLISLDPENSDAP